MAQSAGGVPAKRVLGPWMSTALVVGNMIGSGVFLLPASLAAYGGTSIVGWLFTTAGALLLALVFARLGRAFPKIGGPYAYSRAGFGDVIGFQVAWGYWIAIWAGNAAIAIAFVGYLGYFWSGLASSPMLAAIVAIAAVWLLTVINAAGIRPAGIVQLLIQSGPAEATLRRGLSDRARVPPRGRQGEGEAGGRVARSDAQPRPRGSVASPGQVESIVAELQTQDTSLPERHAIATFRDTVVT